MEYHHKPVLLKEVLEFLRPQAGQFFVDGTLGGGGYTRALAKAAGDSGLVLSFDLDPKAVKNAGKNLKNKKQIIIINDNYKNLSEVIKDRWPEKAPAFDGIVLDLGLSSAQLSDQHRGFSFKLDAPLDMSFGGGQKRTFNIINNYKEQALARLIRKYGEERFAGPIAREIARSRKEGPIDRTGALIQAISRALPERAKRGKLHFATKTFQALRIATNQELENLESFLPQAVGFLKSRGRIVVVSFHSLEDRIVKNFFRQESRDCICPPKIPICRCGHVKSLEILTKKPVKAGAGEITDNPRSRSALLRAAEKI